MPVTMTLSWTELKLFLREPFTVVFTLALPPLVLYVLAEVFGNTPDPQGRVYRGVGPMEYYTPAYVALIIASLGLIGLPVHIASYRERGVLRRFQAARMPVRAIVASQLAVLFAGSAAGAVIIVTLAKLTYHVAWPVSWPAVVLALMVGVLAFAALGVLLGAALPTARAAQGLGVLLWFLMFMVSGGGPPPEVLGATLADVATFTPLKHLIIAVQDPWLGRGTNWTELAIVTGVLIIASALAVPTLRQRT
jgi:ABC-2 type transport system permease protein